MCTLLCKEYVRSDHPNSGDTVVRSEAKVCTMQQVVTSGLNLGFQCNNYA